LGIPLRTRDVATGVKVPNFECCHWGRARACRTSPYAFFCGGRQGASVAGGWRGWRLEAGGWRLEAGGICPDF